jgi:hypothetical protein
MKCPYTITDRTISVLIDNRMRTVPSTSPSFGALRDALRLPNHDIEQLKELLDLKRFIAKATFGKVQVGDKEVRYNGEVMHGVLTERMIALMSEGHDIEPIARFMDNVMQNPIVEARNTLFTWLERGSMPITPDGEFIAFKRVRQDYRDYHSGTVLYKVGTTVQKKIDGVPTVLGGACGHALHFCSFGYLDGFHSEPGCRTLIVKINPRNVVGIDPYETTKGQTTEMFVMSEMDVEDLPTKVVGKNLYKAPAVPQHEPEVAASMLAGAGGIETNMATGINKAISGAVTQSQPSDASNTAPVAGNQGKAPQDGADSTTSIPAKDNGKMAIKTTKSGAFKFERNGVSFTEAQVRKAAKLGMRPGARELGVPKSTFQSWVEKIA